MPGFNQTPTSVSAIVEEKKNDENANANQKAFAAFKASLPDKKKHLEKLLTLQFFALCPNGKRIPVEKMDEEYRKDPTGLVYRSVEDRLVLVIQAMFPGEKMPYWQQAFYMSTGESSGMSKTWLPFNGIILQGYASAYSYSWKGKELRSDKLIYVEPWFSKEDFCNPGMRLGLFFPTELEERKKEVLRDLYGIYYLPEGNYHKVNSRFDRFGTPSYVLASHAIGGRVFEFHMGDHIFEDRLGDTELELLYRERVNTPQLLQKCFEEMVTSYPITKPNEVNDYIDRHHAMVYMNAFRQQGIFPPGLKFANVPIKTFGYEMPLEHKWSSLSTAVSAIWQNYMLGKVSLEEVRKYLEKPETHIDQIKDMLEDCASVDKGFTFNIPENWAANKTKLTNYFGGRPFPGKRKGGNRTQRRSKVIYVPAKEEVKNITTLTDENLAQLGNNAMVFEYTKNYHISIQTALEDLERMKREYNYTTHYVQDMKALENPSSYRFLPVYQEGYAIDEIRGNNGLITWGTADCVVIAAYNPTKGMYMTHSLQFNHFSTNATSSAYNKRKSGVEISIPCKGETLSASFPSWITEEGTRVFLYSMFPGTILNRVKQLRFLYRGPIDVYCGASWDGKSAMIIGANLKQKKLVYDDWVLDGNTCIGLTSDGFFGVLYPSVQTAPDQLKKANDMFQKYVEGITKGTSDSSRKCVYAIPDDVRAMATTAPTPSSSNNKNKNNNNNNNINLSRLVRRHRGGKRKTQRRNRK